MDYPRAKPQDGNGALPALAAPPESIYPDPMSAHQPTSGDLPPNWVETRVGDLTVLCRRELSDVLVSLYSGSRWVYDAVASDPESRRLRGRRPVIVGSVDEHPLVVKRLHHGGLLAPITRDRFFTSARARAHVATARYLHERGVKTPGVAFVSWRRVHGLVRCEVAFDFVPGAVDADQYFFAEHEPPADWKTKSTRIGSLVARLHQIGVVHPDLNLMNFLFGSSGDTYILDLDKTAVRRRPATSLERKANLDRLERSIRKQGRRADGSLVEHLVASVRSSYRQALGAVPALIGSYLVIQSKLSGAAGLLSQV